MSPQAASTAKTIAEAISQSGSPPGAAPAAAPYPGSRCAAGPGRLGIKVQHPVDLGCRRPPQDAVGSKIRMAALEGNHGIPGLGAAMAVK